MSSFAQKNARRALLEKSFFLSSRPVLTTNQLGAVGSLRGIPILDELSKRCNLILASREGVEIHLVFPTLEAAKAAQTLATAEGVVLKNGPSPVLWKDQNGLDQSRTPFDRFYFMPFMDLTLPSSSHFESDNFIHTFWSHNFAWYSLTRQIRSCAPGFFVVPNIRSQVEAFLREDARTGTRRRPSALRVETQQDDLRPHTGAEGEDDADATLIGIGMTEMLIESSPSQTTRQPSPKRTPTSPPLYAPSGSSKRPRSTEPLATPSGTDLTLLDLPPRPASTLPSISLSMASPREFSSSNTLLVPPATIALSSSPSQSSTTSGSPELPHSSPALQKTPPTIARATPASTPSSQGLQAPQQLLNRSTLVPSALSEKRTKALLHGPEYACLRILRRRVGYTIGAGGVHLKQVRAETQVTVHIEDSLIDDYSVAYFFGVESDLRQRAVEMVGSRALRSPDRVEDNLVALE